MLKDLTENSTANKAMKNQKTQDQHGEPRQALPTPSGSRFPLSDNQLHFGEMQLERTSNRWGVTPLQAAKIMIDVAYIKEAWNWVNMDEFLNNYIHQNA